MQYKKIIKISVALVGLTVGAGAWAVVDPDELADVAQNAEGVIEHCDEAVDSRDFIEVFECGDELFETRFNAIDGIGMDVGDGNRFARAPRADQFNWRNTIPPRATGPNALACNSCHLAESIGNAGDGAGTPALNAVRDPFFTANPGKFIQRQTPHLFGLGGPQLVAQEMTDDLLAIRAQAIAQAGQGFERPRICFFRPFLSICQAPSVTLDLVTKGVNFGTITASADGKVDTSGVVGVSTDLIVRPFQWKGNFLSTRDFSRDAFHNELGMNPVELAGDNVDGDFDGVVNEIFIEDTTAMSVYLAGQPRPVSLIELDDLRDTLIAQFGADGAAKADAVFLPDLTPAMRAQINQGEQIFADIGCADCHRPSLSTSNTIFTEPSQNPNYREAVFPGGQNAVARGVDPDDPVFFDITFDQPDNIIEVNGVEVARLGSFETDANGAAVVRLYGDLKLHDMGPRLAENIDETGAGASVWITKELWGLAFTAPYLHDGRATTVEEAIIEHGGEATDSRINFAGLTNDDQDAVLAFLNNLTLFFQAEE